MLAKVEKEVERILEMIAKTDDPQKLRELALVVESLAMTYIRVRG